MELKRIQFVEKSNFPFIQKKNTKVQHFYTSGIKSIQITKKKKRFFLQIKSNNARK